MSYSLGGSSSNCVPIRRFSHWQIGTAHDAEEGRGRSQISKAPTSGQWSWNPQGDTLYCKEIPIRLRAPGSGEQFVPLTVKILNEGNAGRPNSRLHVELTNEADPLFLYTLDIDENEFFLLKSEQRLLVDFQAFPAKFVELLEECLVASQSESTRQRLSGIFLCSSAAPHETSHRSDGPPHGDRLSATNSSASTVSPPATNSFAVVPPCQGRLSLVEANQFKELTHLSLVFRQGDDNAIKRHLARKLGAVKICANELELNLNRLTSDHEVTLSDLDAVKAEITALEALRKAEREAAIQSHKDEVKTLNNENEAKVEALNRTLATEAERTIRLQTQISSLEAKRSELETAHTVDTQQLRTLTLEVAELRLRAVTSEEAKHATETRTAELQNKLVITERDLVNARLQIEKYVENVEMETSERSGILAHARELEEKMTEAAKEIQRGNEIITKQRADIRVLKSKAKHGSDAEKAVAKLTKECEALESMKGELTVARAELSETQTLLTKKQSVIDSLNKQLTEKELKSILDKFPSPPSSIMASAAAATTNVSGGLPAVAALLGGGGRYSAAPPNGFSASMPPFGPPKLWSTALPLAGTASATSAATMVAGSGLTATAVGTGSSPPPTATTRRGGAARAGGGLQSDFFRCDDTASYVPLPHTAGYLPQTILVPSRPSSEFGVLRHGTSQHSLQPSGPSASAVHFCQPSETVGSRRFSSFSQNGSQLQDDELFAAETTIQSSQSQQQSRRHSVAASEAAADATAQEDDFHPLPVPRQHN